MKIIGVTMASNEADVVESFVRHNLRFLDALVVLDHGSVDATQEILRRLAEEGAALVVLQDRDRAFRQDVRITMLARRYLAELDADWCFALDADEFIRAPSRAELERSLSRIPPGVHGLVPLQNYVGAGADAGEPHVPRRITRRLREERTPQRKVAIRRGFETLPSGQVSMGNHAVVQVVGGKVIALPHVPVEGLTHAHFPVRSAEQVAQKVLVGWLAMRLTRPERFAKPGQPGPASHWKALFARLASGEAPDASFVAEAVSIYTGGPVAEQDLVEDPLESPVEIRHAAAARIAPFATLARWADQVVGEIAARTN